MSNIKTVYAFISEENGGGIVGGEVDGLGFVPFVTGSIHMLKPLAYKAEIIGRISGHPISICTYEVSAETTLQDFLKQGKL